MRRTLFYFGLVLACYLSGPGTAQGRRPSHSWTPHLSAVRDWRFWAGEGLIAVSVALDAKSTCDGFGHGFVEGGTIQHGGHNCAVTAGAMVGAGAFYTSLNLIGHKYAVDPNDGWFRNVAAFAVPASVAAVHLSTAARNWTVAPPPDTAAARARLAQGSN
jgi:hypothetical protein